MDSDTPDDDGVSDARNYLNSLSSHPGRAGDTSFLHPQFAVRLANSIKDARAAGLPVGMESGFRPPNATGSNYDASGLSLHDKGAAADINGLGSAGSPQAQQWAQIAAKNGLYNPYGINDPREFNHWQLVPWTLESRPDVQAKIVGSGGDANKIWNAVAPTSAPGLSFSAPPGQSSAPALAAISGPRSLTGYKTALQTPPPLDPFSEYPTAKASDTVAQVDPFKEYPTAAAPTAVAPVTVAPPVSVANAPLDPFKEYPTAGPAIPVSGSPSSFPPGLPPGSYPFGDPRNFVYKNGADATNNSPAVDPTQPLATNLSVANSQGMKNINDAFSGVPSAIRDAYDAATSMAAQGVAENASGNALPTFPSADPRTWTGGGALHSLLGGLGQVAAPLTGAVNQLVQNPTTQATGSPDIGERAGVVANALAGPALGRVAGAAGSGVGNALIGGVDPETARLVQLANQKYGIPITGPQMSSSKLLQNTSSVLNGMPLSGGGAFLGRQQDQWLRGVSNTIGEDATRLTPDVMNAARQRIGSYYDQVAQNVPAIKMDPQFFQDLHDTLNNANRYVNEDGTKLLVKNAQDILQKIDPTTGTISPQAYKGLTDTGTPLDRLTGGEDSNMANAASKLKDALDGALARSSPQESQDLLRTADRQYAALKTIQPLAAKAPTGEISPALLAGRVNAKTDNGLAFGKGGDLGELARIGQRFLKEPGSSNTAERALVYGGLIGGGGVGAHDLINAISTGDPMAIAGPAGIAAAGLTTGNVVGRVLRSQPLANSMLRRSLAPSSPGGLDTPFGVISGVGGNSALLNPPINALAAPNQQ